jgi:hypothetical protein
MSLLLATIHRQRSFDFIARMFFNFGEHRIWRHLSVFFAFGARCVTLYKFQFDPVHTACATGGLESMSPAVVGVNLHVLDS